MVYTFRVPVLRCEHERGGALTTWCIEHCLKPPLCCDSDCPIGVCACRKECRYPMFREFDQERNHSLLTVLRRNVNRRHPLPISGNEVRFDSDELFATVLQRRFENGLHNLNMAKAACVVQRS
jgi:hypothetical protein